jgi:ketosteroid isomerase-like protein
MTEADETTIRENMREIYRAFLERDVEALGRAFADDFTFSDPAGPVVSKEEWLEDIASGDLAFECIEAGEPELRLAGDSVVVLGRATLRGRYSKSNYNGTFTYMGVYAKQGDDWKLMLTSADRDPA